MQKIFITIALTFTLISSGLIVSAQNVLLQEEVNLNDPKPRYGQNLAVYRHMYFDLEFPVYENLAGNQIKYGTSFNYTIGLRNKYKICKHDDLGFEVFYVRNRFNMDKTMYEMIDAYPVDQLVNKFSSFGVSAFNRINFGKRGNMIKGYLDLGAYGGIFVRKRSVLEYKDSQEQKVQIVTSKLKNVNDFNYGALLRLGWKSYALKATYRLSDYFKKDSGLDEFPRLSIGAEIGILTK